MGILWHRIHAMPGVLEIFTFNSKTQISDLKLPQMQIYKHNSSHTINM
jgi:hypothetical protein